MTSSSRIARNTLALYFRQILIMLVSLYTVRVVLSTLGAEDYGIYNVVAGVVTMFGFLSGAMATASQRFFSFEMGRGDDEALKKTFSVTLTIYALLTLAVVVLAETAGLWFVSKKLVIPSERLFAAKAVYHFAVASFVFTLMTTPYMSAIIAHENMKVYAYIGIVDAALRLAVVFVLKALAFDKLVVYGALLLCVAAINTSLYRLYCKKRCAECRFKLLWDKKMFREIFSFTGWTLFGSFATVARNQAVTVLLNQFFTPIVVAARSVAQQVSNAVRMFSTNFNTSLYPPIIKEYSAGEKDKMFSLVFNGCKMTFFLMWAFALPLIFEMESVLSIWLGNPPEFTVLFTRLSAVEVLIDSLSFPIGTLARAPGKMKNYELILGTMNISIFFVSFVFFKFGFGASATFYVAIAINLLMIPARLLIVRNLVGLKISDFFKKTFLPLLMMMILSFGLSLAVQKIIVGGFFALFARCVLMVLISCVSMFFLGMSKAQRVAVVSAAREKFRKGDR